LFKSWQVLVFSLVPLVLVFIGVIGGSIHGSDSEPEEFPTAAPASASSSAPPPSAPAGTVVLPITAQNSLFSPRTLTAPPNTSVIVRMNNLDAGVLHNVSVYTNNQATGRIFVSTDLSAGGTKDYAFTTPGAGTYFFRCDVHPDTMTGTFNVR
jgi:plastocyanin